MTEIAEVNVVRGAVPADYHCSCRFCQKVIGELREPGGGYYSRLERRRYYDPAEHREGGHLAKTPLHIARWAVQRYTRAGDWVLDPMIGAGTTAVEAVVQGRNAVGMELQYEHVLRANLEKAVAVRRGMNGRSPPPRVLVQIGDARSIGAFLDEAAGEEGGPPGYQLVVNNPPYSGDKSDVLKSNKRRGDYSYDPSLPNLAFLREGPEYWQTIRTIYGACVDRMLPGAHFVTGIKDQMRNRQPDQLHARFCQVLEELGLRFVGTAFLKHYPGTLHLHTYEKKYGVRPPLYQTISVFRKEKGK